MKAFKICISISFSLILGNAEMTEIFQCEKSKTTCCSPKSAIKEQKIQQRRQAIRNEIKRQDTNQIQFIDTKPRPQIGPVKPTLEHPVTNKYVWTSIEGGLFAETQTISPPITSHDIVLFKLLESV